MKANPNYIFLKQNVPSERITLLQGGTRSGKTYSVIYYIIDLCRKYPNAGMEIDITRDTFTALKATVWKDFKDVLLLHGLYNVDNHNRTDHIYHLYGNVINYYGADNPHKIHGRSRDVLWVNEGQHFPEETIDQLFPRTRHRIICDYNPALPREHWLDKYIPKYSPLITTYRDNPHLTKSQIEDIESRKGNSYWWSVYGTGERAQPTGAIYTNWKRGKFPENVDSVFGMDFGFSDHPTALVETYIDQRDKKIYIKQHAYSSGLKTSDIYDICKNAAGNRLIVADSAEDRLVVELQGRGLNIVPYKKLPGSVNAGIMLIQDYQLIIEGHDVEIEATNYHWADKGKTVPVKEKDDAMDAVRYAVDYQLSNPNKGKYYVY